MQPTVVLRSASIDCDYVLGEACGAASDEGNCFLFRLTDPQVGCRGRQAGPWCLSVAEGSPGDEVLDTVAEHLAAETPDAVWFERESALPTSSRIAVLTARGAVWALFLWLVWGLVGLVRRRSEWDRRELIVWGAIGVGGALVRLFLAPGAPSDLRFRLESVFAGTAAVEEHGHGFPALVTALFQFVSPGDEAIFAMNAVLGAATVLPLGALALRLGAPRSASWLAGAILALMPLHVAFSHTDAPFIPEVFFGLVGLWALLRYMDEARNSDAILAAIALGLAAQMRPEGLFFGLAAAGWVAAHLRRVPWKKSATWLAMAVFGALVAVHVRDMTAAAGELTGYFDAGISCEGVSGCFQYAFSFFVFLDVAYMPVALLVALPLGLLHPSIPRANRIWLLLVLFAMALLLPSMSPADLNLANARYQLRSLPFASLLSAVGLVWAGRWLRPRWRPIAAGLVLVSMVGWHGVATRQTTLSQEYRFFADHLEEVPRGCMIVTLLDTSDLDLVPRHHLSLARELGHYWRDITRIRPDALPRGCVSYYRAASCSVGQERCLPFEESLQLEPLSEAFLEPVSFNNAAYADDRVRVGYYRVLGPSAGK